MRKLRIAAVIVTAVAAIAGVISYDHFINPAAAKDCSTNAVIKCGVWSVNEMRAAYYSDRTPGTRNIFAGMGITREMINHSVIKEGVVGKDGRVIVGGKVVATGASSAGRTIMSHTKQRIKHSHGGTTYYESKTSDSFRSNQLAAYVLFDNTGRFQGAIIKDCGNPVRAIPATNPAAACSVLDQPIITNRTKVTLKAAATAKDGGKIEGYTFTITDAKGKVVFAKPVDSNKLQAKVSTEITTAGTYTAKVVVHTNLGNSSPQACQKPFTIKPAPPAPVATCSALDKPITITDRTKVTLKAHATADHGAVIKGYVFTVTNSKGVVVASKEVTTADKSATATLSITEPGDYKAKVVVKTSLSDNTTSPQCEGTFTIKPADKPGIAINKVVEGKEHITVEMNKPFVYEVTVTNTGNVALKNAVVSDPAKKGLVFKSADKGTITNNKWSYTIPELPVGKSITFKITAIVTEEIPGKLTNTACVETPTIPGKPVCDDAHVSTKIKITVCDVTTKKVVTIPKDQAEADPKRYVAADSDLCKEPTPVTPAPKTPPVLPRSGSGNLVLSSLGLGALITAGAAYALSRRGLSA